MRRAFPTQAALTGSPQRLSVHPMLDQMDIIEIALRGAAAGVNILIAVLIFISRAPLIRRALGVLFLIGTACYILVSGPAIVESSGVFKYPMIAFAIFNGVFFWWFAQSLFEDDFRWTWVKVAPFIIMVLLHPPGGAFWEEGLAKTVERVLHSALAILLMGHAMWIALRDRAGDLVDPRRRFRLSFALAVGVTGIVVTVAENIEILHDLPEAMTFLHAILIAALSFFFGSWLLSANRALYAADEPPPAAPSEAIRPVPAADMPAFETLTALMDEGIYHQEGLSVAALAEKVGVPEHQLRKLINGALGYRNFSAFLNSYRIEEAKRILADPAEARRQILQIALDLGYGSIAPFNRAFKSATGETPTEYRRAAIENS